MEDDRFFHETTESAPNLPIYPLRKCYYESQLGRMKSIQRMHRVLNDFVFYNPRVIQSSFLRGHFFRKLAKGMSKLN